MEVDRLADGLWRWTAPHPDWTPEEGPYGGWGRDVSCVYHEAEEGIVLIDPLVPDDEDNAARFWRALDGDVERIGTPPTVAISVRWHGRSAADIRARYDGARVLAVQPLDDCEVDGALRDGDRLPGGIEVLVPDAPGEARMSLLRCACHGLLWTADYLLGDDTGGLSRTPASWFDEEQDRRWMEQHAAEAVLAAAHGVRVVIPAHGRPVTEHPAEALAHALA